MTKLANFANTISSVLEVPSALFSNEFPAVNEASKTRWVCLAPYGDWPNAQGLQRFQKPDAVAIVNEFNSLLNTPQRILGAPWYIGHPDHPAFNERYKDTKAYGRIKTLEAREDGLWAGIKFNPDGERLIADEAFHGHSVNWFLKQDAADKRAWRPFRLKSVGFTNEPNIPVSPVTLANEFTRGEALRQAHYRKLAGFRLLANGAPIGNKNAAPGTEYKGPRKAGTGELKPKSLASIQRNLAKFRSSRSSTGGMVGKGSD